MRILLISAGAVDSGNIPIGYVMAILGVLVPLTSLASFYFGRRKEAMLDAKGEATLVTQFSHLSTQLMETRKSVEAISNKIDDNNKSMESQYRDTLVQLTTLKNVTSNLEQRVDKLESKNKGD